MCGIERDIYGLKQASVYMPVTSFDVSFSCIFIQLYKEPVSLSICSSLHEI